jgi:probable HAF family extracellular repeat protein
MKISPTRQHLRVVLAGALTAALALVIAAAGDFSQAFATPANASAAQYQYGGQTGYSITDLGTLGSYTSWATAINESGQITGSSYVTSSVRHAFLWERGVMRDLGTLGGTRSDSYALNDAGQVVGESTTTQGETHAFLWENGVMTDLGTLGGNWSSALGLNAAGQVVGLSFTATGETRAFLWEDGVMLDMGELSVRGISDGGLVAGTSQNAAGQRMVSVWQDGVMTDLFPGEAWGISEAGYVVGYVGGVSSAANAFVWRGAGEFSVLGTLGGRHSYARVANDVGEVAGYSYTAAGDQHAFFWRDGVMADLGTLGGNTSDVSAINNHGQVVGWSYTTTGAYPHDSVFAHAYVWHDGVMTDLGTLSSSPAWSATQATSINDLGYIVGTASPSGPRAILWEPVTDTTPPEITVPDDVTVDATSPDGAVVEFTATATDDVDGDVPVECTPASGSTFAIGDTTVECTATDAAGNSATASFTVHVKGASEQLDDLAEAVMGVGPGTSLADKVQAAQTALTDGDDTGACEILNAFTNQVEAQSGKGIDTTTADDLIADATRIRAVLGCPQ